MPLYARTVEPTDWNSVREGEDLPLRLRSGDAAALEEWVRAQAGPLLRVARRYLRDEGEAQEAVRDALLHALEILPTHESAVPSTWLHDLMLKITFEKLRTRPPRPEAPIDAFLPRFRADGTHEEEPRAWPLSGAACSPGSAFEKRLHGCIERLPESHRTVLLLREADQQHTRAIARHLGMSESLVRRRLREAHVALRTLLDPYMRSDAPSVAPRET